MVGLSQWICPKYHVKCKLSLLDCLVGRNFPMFNPIQKVKRLKHALWIDMRHDMHAHTHTHCSTQISKSHIKIPGFFSLQFMVRYPVDVPAIFVLFTTIIINYYFFCLHVWMYIQFFVDSHSISYRIDNLQWRIGDFNYNCLLFLLVEMGDRRTMHFPSSKFPT